MKKIFSIVLLIIFMVCFCRITVMANSEVPIFDATYNNNAGIFYANGTEITINKNSNNETIITWENGTQIVPNTVTVVGGGKDGETYSNSKITIDGGKVGIIYGGGFSITDNMISKVENAKVIINGGTVSETVYAGGLMYTTTDKTEIVVNGGNVKAIVGGGCASATINGVTYSAGILGDEVNSKNRTNNTKITINNGVIDSIPSNYGMIFGGGQGYSYVDKSEIEIYGGELSKAYITAGGSNGYTENSKVNINGGIIKVLQSVNRGIVQNAEIKVNGGVIKKAYVGGETEDTSVTGIIRKVAFSVISGKIENLENGKSNSEVIEIDQNMYKVITIKGTVINDNTNNTREITFRINIKPDDTKVFENEQKKMRIEIITVPEGYEDLIASEKVLWKIQNEEIATVDEQGIVLGKKLGNTTISATVLNHTDEETISIERNAIPIIENINTTLNEVGTGIIVGMIVLGIIVIGIISVILWYIIQIFKFIKCKKHHPHNSCEHCDNHCGHCTQWICEERNSNKE